MRTSRKKRRQRGVAILAVLVILTLAAGTALEFFQSSTVDYSSAVIARDELRAHYLARSAMNMSRLVIKVQKDVLDRYRKFIGDTQLADYLPMMSVAFFGSQQQVKDMAGLLGNIDTDSIKGLGLPPGMEIDIEVGSDDGKYNVNCAGGSQTAQQDLEKKLTLMVNDPSLNKLFEERDGDGQFTDRVTFVRAIIDYIDRDTLAYGTNGGAEEYGYSGFRDPYEARNNYVDTIDELQLVRGMDDKKWEIFGPKLTVYGGCKINVAAVTDAGAIRALILGAAKNPEDPVLLDEVKLMALAARVVQARSLGYYFDDLTAFAEFVKDPDAALNALGAEGGGTGSTLTNLQQGLFGGPAIEGVELDQAKLAQIARTGGRRTYRVMAQVRVGRVEKDKDGNEVLVPTVEKNMTGVWDTDTQNVNPRDPSQQRGTWVYWREE